MAGTASYPPALVVVGANHRSSSAALRDKVFVDDASAPAFLGDLRASGIAQAIVLSTCDRVEVQAIHANLEAAAAAVVGALAGRAGLAVAECDGQIYRLEGEPALHHVFCVAASLDSQIVGEPQVLGQVKASLRLARAQGMAGPDLDKILQAAYGAAKRVRNETAIAEGPVSMAAAAAELARDVHGDLSRCTALLLGGDDMGELVAEHLIAGGLGRLQVAAPTRRRADALARRFDCHTIAFEGFAAALAETDIVLAAAGGRRHLIDAEMVESALRRRRRRPLFLIDAAVPGDIAPEVNRIAEAFLYDLADLEGVALAGRASRESATETARAIVADEIATFRRGQAEREAVPAVTALREHFESVRADVLREAGGDAEQATRLLIGRLLHDPSAALRALSAAGDGAAAERVLRRLFALDSGDKETKS